MEAGASFAQTAGDLLLGAPLGPGGGTLPLLTRSFGNGTMTARQGGGSLRQQLTYGSFVAAAELLTSKLSNAALPFKTAYGRGSFGLDEKLDAVIVLAVGRFAGTPVGQLVLGGIASAGKSFLMEGLEEFLGDWLEWQSPRLYGGGVNSLSEQLASSLNSFFTGGFSGLFGAALDPGNYRYGTGENAVADALPSYQEFKSPLVKESKKTIWQSYLDEYDRKEYEKAIALSEDFGIINLDDVFFRFSPVDRSNPTEPSGRPTWRQSEKDFGRRFPDYFPQVSFKDRMEVKWGTKNSVRPDYYKPGESVEVKNYNVTTASGLRSLKNNILTHAEERRAHLPENTKQTVVLDVRGQGLSYEGLLRVYSELRRDTEEYIGIKISFG